MSKSLNLPPTATAPATPSSPNRAATATVRRPTSSAAPSSAGAGLPSIPTVDYRLVQRDVEHKREASTLMQRKIVEYVKGVHDAAWRVEEKLQQLEDRDERARMLLAAQNLDINANALSSQMRALSLIEDLEGRREQIDFLQQSVGSRMRDRREQLSIGAAEDRDVEIKATEAQSDEWLQAVGASLEVKASRENSVISICSKLSDNLKEMYMRATRVVDEGLLHALYKLDVLKIHAGRTAMDQEWLLALKDLQQALFEAQQEAKRQQLQQDATKDRLNRLIGALAAGVADPLLVSLLREPDVPGGERPDLLVPGLDDTAALEEMAARARPREAERAQRRSSTPGAEAARAEAERLRKGMEEATGRMREAEGRLLAREEQLERDFRELQAAAGSQDLLLVRSLQATVQEWRGRWDEAQAEVGAYQMRLDERDADLRRREEELEEAAAREAKLQHRIEELEEQLRAFEAGAAGDSGAVLARVAAAEAAAARACEELAELRKHTRELEAAGPHPPEPPPAAAAAGPAPEAHEAHAAALAVPEEGHRGRQASGDKGGRRSRGQSRERRSEGPGPSGLAPPRPVSRARSPSVEPEEGMEADVDAEPFPTYKRAGDGHLVAMRGVPVQTDDELIEPLLVDRVRGYILNEDEWKGYTGEPKTLAAKYGTGRPSALTLEEKERLRKERWRAARNEIRAEVVRRYLADEAAHGHAHGPPSFPGLGPLLPPMPAPPGGGVDGGVWRLGGDSAGVSSRLALGPAAPSSGPLRKRAASQPAASPIAARRGSGGPIPLIALAPAAETRAAAAAVGGEIEEGARAMLLATSEEP